MPTSTSSALSGTGMLTLYLHQSRLVGGVMFSTCPSICSSVCLLHDIFNTNEPILLQIGTSGSKGKVMKRSTLGIIIIIIIIITRTMFMVLSSWQSHCESSPGSLDECRMALSGRRPKTKPDDLGCESACTGCQKLHPPSPFIITQPESWYSFYRPTEGRRLSRPSWIVTYRDGLPVHRRSPIRVLTGSDVAQLRWSKPTCYH